MPKLAVTPPRPARPDDSLDRAAHALGEDVGAVLVGVRGEDRELLASHPGGRVPAALALLEGVADRAQDLVARGVPELVVHLLEVVEVADDHAQRLLGAAGALELDVEGLLEPAPVQQAGERVAAGGVAEVGDHVAEAVAHDRHEQPRPAAACRS